MFRRLRVMCQGAVVEDISDYNRLHQMFDTLSSPHVRDNNDIEGFENRFDKVATVTAATMTGLEPGASKVVSFKLLSGIFSQPKPMPTSQTSFGYICEHSHSSNQMKSLDSLRFQQ